MPLLKSGLLPASFRGVPFAVTSSSGAFSRRIALHQYPGRDEAWAEDMGRGARRYRFRGFLVTDDQVYVGGPIQLQRLLLLAAVEKAGSGTLTHPTLGVLTVSVVSATIGEELDAGRYSEIEFEFVETGKQLFPSLLTGSGGLFSAATLATVAIVANAARAIVLATQLVGGREELPVASAAWSAEVGALGGDATALHRLTATLPGPFGRYGQGGNIGFTGSAGGVQASVAELIEAAADRRAAIAAVRADLADAINALTVTATEADVGTAATALVETLARSCADPADALRLLTRLSTFASPLGGPAAAAIADLFRRGAAVQLALAAAAYQPSSYDDALAVLQRVAGLLDAEATIAADQGYDETFRALRDLRAEVVMDLRARGATLAPIRAFELGAALPALALAQRLYRDPARADQLVRQADPVSPLFMPPAFAALAA